MDISDDDGVTIANAIRAGTAIAVSDGSLKLQTGTAAFVIEGPNKSHRIRGVTDVPGPLSDGDSHRPELTGLFAIAVFINTLCSFHRVTQGTVTIACDNKNAIDTLDPDFTPDPSMKNFDLVHAVWATIKESPIQWKGQHVKGHQDKNKQKLTRLELLNIEMDKLAKTYWRHLYANPNAPLHQPVARQIYNEGWSIWAGTEKIVNPHRRTLYQRLQDPITQQYWVRHGRYNEASTNNIDWDIVTRANLRLPPARRRWITKHASNNCGVGQTLVEWKFQTDAACPRCGADEDTTHVLRCTRTGAQEHWHNGIQKLEASLTRLRTDPFITSTILLCLQTWRNKATLSPRLVPTHILPAVRQQCQIGWKNLLYGLIAKDWRQIQQTYYDTNNICGSSKKWATSLVVLLHHLAWGQWDQRNTVKYKSHKPRERTASTLLDRQITRELLLGVRDLPPGDRHHFRHNLITLLRRNEKYKRAWFVNVTMARERQQNRRNGNEAERIRSRETSLLLKYFKTGRCF
jgi:hypothetical protein